MNEDIDDLEKGPCFAQELNKSKQALVKNLVLAAKNGDEATVCDILGQEGTEVVNCKYKFETALMAAAKTNNANIVQALLNHESDVNVCRIFQQSSLWIASLHGNLAAMEMMINTGKCSQANLDNSFLRCAAMNFYDGCDILLEAGASVDVKENMEFAAIHRAAGNSDESAISLWRLYNPESFRLYHASSLQICQLLIERGADVNALDYLQSTPLHHAAESGQEDIGQLLIANGAEINAVGGSFLRTPLHVCAGKDCSSLLRILLHQPEIDANIVDLEKDTALMAAIKLHKKESVKAFLEHERWSEFMSVKSESADGYINTPFRLLIRQMPDMAALVMSKCVELDTFKDSKHPDFTARFSFMFLDDTYTSKHWETSQGKIADGSIARNSESQFSQPAMKKGPCEKKIDAKNGEKKKINNGLTIPVSNLSPKQNSSVLWDLKQTKAPSCEPQCFTCLSNENCCKLKPKCESYTKARRTLKENHPLTIMCSEKASKILCHPLTIALMNYKWRTIARYSFYGNLFIYFVFVVLLSTYILKELQENPINNTRPTNLTQDNTSTLEREHNHSCAFLPYFVLGMASLELLKEVYLIFTQKYAYFFVSGNYIELFLYTSAIVIVADAEGFAETLPIYRLSVICVFMAWFNLMLGLRKVPTIGIFFIMFTRILKNSITVLLIFTPLLIGFSLTFSILIGNTHPLFHLQHSYPTILVMLSGEVEYVDTLSKGATMNPDIKNAGITIAAYVFFIIFMVICLLNMLVGLAVSDVERLHRESEAEMMRLKTEEVLYCEFYLSLPWNRKSAIGCLRLHPNKRALFFSKCTKAPIRKKLMNWFHYLEFRDPRLSAANLLRSRRNEDPKIYDLLRKEIADLRNQIDITSQYLTPATSRTETRLSKKFGSRRSFRPLP